LGALRDFVGDAVIVGHNVASDLSFLNYEAIWHGQPPFGNPALDTQELARRLLGDRQRLDLSGVSTALGLSQAQRHRALADARLTLDVLLALLSRVDSDSARTFSELQSWLSSTLAERQARVRRVRSVLPADAIRSLPEAPGVYTLRDGAGQALYVGKALSLRERVARHFTGSGRAIRLDEGLLDRTAAVDHQVVDTELDALLLEAHLIRDLRPLYNVQQHSRRSCPYVQVLHGAFPRLAAATTIRGDPADYVGPYRTTQAARHTIRTVQRVFQIRSCRRALPATRAAMRVPCLRLGQQLCPAPCADAVTRQQYDTLLHFARLFLVAGKEPTLAALDERIQHLEGCESVDRWLVAALREARARLQRIRRTYRPLEGCLAGEALVMAYPAPAGGLTLFLVRDGRRVGRSHVPIPCEHSPLAAVEAILHQWQETPCDDEPGHKTAGEAEVDLLLRWIYRHTGSPNLVPWPPERAARDVAAAVLSVADLDHSESEP
jgi:DNA polymerase-3 subunit epsilon